MVALAALLALSASPVRAAPADLLGNVAIGFAGRARLGAWTPVWIEVTAPPGGLEGTVIIDAAATIGAPLVRYEAPIRAAGGARVRVFVPVIFYDARTPGVIHVDDARGRLASLALPRLKAVDEVVVVLSSEPVGLESVTDASGERPEIAYVSPEDLPPVWQAYEALRLMVVRTLDERRIGDPQRTAIRHWVWSGGRVLVMPAGDDIRHLQGATLGALLPGQVSATRPDTHTPSVVIRPRPGSDVRLEDGVTMVRRRAGRGRAILWDRDSAEQALRAGAGLQHAWQTILADRASPPAAELENTLAAQRPVPVRTHLLVGGLLLVYIVVARRLGAVLGRWQPAGAALAIVGVIAATAGAAQVAAVARRDASGVIGATVVESMPGTGHGLVTVLARTVLSHEGGFSVSAGRELLLRPIPPSPVTVVRGAETLVRGTERSVRLSGSAVVPVSISGTFAPRGDGATVAVTNLSSWILRKPWIYAAGRVQSIPDIASSTQVTLEEHRWQARDRLQRTEPNHALLLWAFSHLESDAILKATPAWLIGWAHDPALALRWGDRPEPAPQLVLVPLTAP
ncbi:MAG: hypothetical protein ACT4PY_15400 [Armatimonadota bacterium]